MLSYQVKCYSGVQCLLSSGRHGKAVLRKKAYSFIGHSFCSVECAILWYGRLGGAEVGDSSVRGGETGELPVQRPVVRPLELGGIFPVGLGVSMALSTVSEKNPGSELGELSGVAIAEDVPLGVLEEESRLGGDLRSSDLEVEAQTEALEEEPEERVLPEIDPPEELDARTHAARVIQGIAYDAR